MQLLASNNNRSRLFHLHIVHTTDCMLDDHDVCMHQTMYKMLIGDNQFVCMHETTFTMLIGVELNKQDKVIMPWLAVQTVAIQCESRSPHDNTLLVAYQR
jgi:hypothetical protein